jgi:hypothetical protein
MADRVTVLAVFNALLRITKSDAKLEMMLKETDAVIDRFTASWAAAERRMPGAVKKQTDKAQAKLTGAMKGGRASETEKNVFQRALHRLANET